MKEFYNFLQKNFKTSFSIILIGLYISIGFLQANGWKFEKEFVNTLLNFAWIGIFVNFGERAISVVGSKLQGLKLMGDNQNQPINYQPITIPPTPTQYCENCPKNNIDKINNGI
jgi:uncharacterized membrane protein (DUF485 family)